MATELLDAWYNAVWRTIRRYSAGSAAGITTRSSVASRWSISAKPCSNRLHPLVEPLAVFAPVVPETLNAALYRVDSATQIRSSWSSATARARLDPAV